MPRSSQDGSTRDRLVRAAADLFAQHGFASTSVAQIQAAVGLHPGSGALYKHFRSKEELLDAIVADYLGRLSAETGDLLDALPLEPVHALAPIAVAVRESMHRDAAVLRLLLRDLDHRDDLRAQVWAAVLQAVPGRFATWVERARRAGTVPDGVTRDDAVVLMAALMQSSTMSVLADCHFEPALTGTFEEAWALTAARCLDAR